MYSRKRFPLRLVLAVTSGQLLFAPGIRAQQATPGAAPSDSLDEVVVTGVRRSLEASLNIKQEAVNVIDTIGAEDIGKFPDLNLSESLQRIPGVTLDHLFESLYEQRSGRDDKPHFGLGLYIVKLIAEFHGGSARAANREDGGGAVFTVTLPMI